MKKIFAILFLLVSLLVSSGPTQAGFVPGTIEKKTFTSWAETCIIKSNSYKTWFSCTTKTCQTYNYWENASCGCKEYEQVQDECIEYNKWTCLQYEQEEVRSCYMVANRSWSDALCWGGCILVDGLESCWDACGNLEPGCTWRIQTTKIPTWKCLVYDDDATCKTWSYKDGTTCKTYNSCRTSWNGCQTWSDSKTVWDYDSYNDYNLSKSDYKFWSQFSNAIPEDKNLSCYAQASGTKHSAPYGNKYSTCDTNNGYYQPYGWSDGKCNSFKNQDTLLTSYDQYGEATFSNPVSNSSKCKIEWRVAQIDNQGPKITVSWSPFQKSSEQQWWCNIEKYTTSWDYKDLPYGSDASPSSDGCEFYWAKWWKDLFENLVIKIDDPSGLQEVKIEIGSCTVVYDNLLPENGLKWIIDTNGWVKSEYTKPLELYFNAPSEYWDYRSEISLRWHIYNQNGGIAMKDFGSFDHDEVLRIDKLCLQEGKNYMTITAKDASTSDGYTLGWNSATQSTVQNQEFIKVDNAGVKIGTIGDQPSTTQWYNEDLSWEFSFVDTYKSGVKECTTFVKSDETGKCTNTKPERSFWTSPYGVNAQWEFPIFTCDGKEVFPPDTCNWACESGYEKKWDTCEKIIQPSKCWELWRSQLGMNTEFCEYVPVYSWHSTPSGICYTNVEPIFITCKNDLGQTVDQKYCNESEKPEPFRPCSWSSIY